MKIHLQLVEELHGYGQENDGDSEVAVFQISTDSKNDTFTVEENCFLFAEAQGNYVFINNLDEKERKSLHRISLTHLEKQLESTHLKRCHRSYLVNLRKVKNITGNAQGLKLRFENSDYGIPVSRKYIPIIRDYF